MQTRPADVSYCGVREAKIKKAKPKLNEENFKHLFNFITERYNIRKKKDVYKQPAPWTQDKILADFKFTNVRREHDRETRWVITKIIENPVLSYSDKLLNIMLYRMFNKSATIELFGVQKFPLNENKVRAILEKKAKEDPKYAFFTNAFLTVGIKVALGNDEKFNDEFMPMRIIKFINFLYKEAKVTQRIRAAKTQKDVYEVVKTYKGLGEFLSYQIFVDFTYIPEFPFSENEFTISGPGCMRGLDNIFEDRDGMTYDESLFWLRDNIDNEFWRREFAWNPNRLFDDLPEYDRHMNVMSLENCHCEISKYIRAATGTGRPKNKYKQTKEGML